jgi:Zn-dependent protease
METPNPSSPPPHTSPAGPREAPADASHWRIGRIWGIPVGLHWSMLFVFGMLTLSLATAFFPDTDPDLPAAAYWAMGLVAAVLFFVSILLHELGHSRVALHNGIPVDSITLFIFGGIARIAGRPKTAGVELAIAIAGPLVSFALAAVFGAIWYLANDLTYLAAPAGWLARLNLILALFNLLPGFPLDGGRILRALVWQVTGNEQRATQVSLVSGQVLAFGLMGVGALLSFNGDFANGIWLIVIGWFLQNAAVSEATGSKVEIALRGATVQQAMGPRETEIPSRTKVRQVIDEHILATGHRYFLVIDGDVPRGVVTLRDLATVPQDRWDWTSVGDIMTPWSRLTVVTPDTDLLAALQVMDDARVSSLPVMDGERVCGLLTREEVLHYVRLRMELQGATA